MYMCTNTCMMNSRADCEVCNITGSHWIFDVKGCDVVGMIETSNTHINAFYKYQYRVTAHGINIILDLTSESVNLLIKLQTLLEHVLTVKCICNSFDRLPGTCTM